MANKFNLNDTVTLNGDIKVKIVGLGTNTIGEPIYTVEYKSANLVISTVRHTTVNERDLTGEPATMNLDADDSIHSEPAAPAEAVSAETLTTDERDVLTLVAQSFEISFYEIEHRTGLRQNTRHVITSLLSKGMLHEQGKRLDKYTHTAKGYSAYLEAQHANTHAATAGDGDSVSEVDEYYRPEHYYHAENVEAGMADRMAQQIASVPEDALYTINAQSARIAHLEAALGAAYDTLINIDAVTWEESVAEAERQIITGLEDAAQ